MELIRGLHNLRPRHKPCVATIGAFDGVHYGHQAVLRQLLAKGAELGLPTTVIVLEPLPREYFAPTKAPARLMSFREKFVAFRDFGIDRVFRIRFTQALSQVSAIEFIEDVFVAGLGVKYVVVGDDLRFGHDREGDFALLQRLGEKHGFAVEDTSTLAIDHERVSSTRIRAALEAADFDLAERLLGKPYTITGKVVYGQQLGRQLDSPTANLELHRHSAALSGVYAVEVLGLGDETKPGVANVGSRPTVDDSVKALLEVHLLNFDSNIYGKTIHVRFRKKLREEKKFASVEELKKNIQADIQTAYDYFGIERKANE